ncbi:30S ribosomal protein S17 [Sinimarinibacterium sp. CAU 1509]|uniref:30S ribosomal protein S17 n=1 Tax=Sinimarinibacterium sp. CAU 1509 TaxID=2562283 RepID=UPI0010ACC518|nr:30S ribosomal protein S17 [Sinimarinibacterium sp. CAU 1509]TJY63160.1 30S ribosomal protein S17 [Sinimarinibacterium sp. CAU 1509]
MSEQQVTKTERRVVGRVISSKPNKTITVLVERRERHPLYGKMLRRSTKLHAHDENNECHEGDRVAIVETRPLSATKRFRLVEILERASALQQAESGA